MNKVAVVVDDHALFADSFSILLEKLNLFEEINVLNDSKARHKYFIKNSDKQIFLFLDYYLTNQLGIEIIKETKKINNNVNIIIISSVTHPITIKTIINLNPSGFISKTAGAHTIVECLQNIKEEKVFYCPFITQILKENSEYTNELLSSREIEILKYFAKGFSVNQTATFFFLSRHTVVAHRRKMMKKTNTNTITELLIYVRKAGLIID